MPLNVYKEIIMDSDTRPLELYLSTCSLVWGLWLLGAAHTVSTQPFWFAINRSGGLALFCTWALFNFVFQALACWYKYPRLRRWASSSCAIYWILTAYAVVTVEPRLFTPWMAAGFAAGQLWVVLHRSTVGK